MCSENVAWTEIEARDDGEPWQSVGDDEEENVDREGGQVLRCSGPQLLCQPRAVNGLAYAITDVKSVVKEIIKKISHRYNEEIYTRNSCL